MQISQHSALIIANEAELKNSDQIWGTGAWLPVEKRNALDWFTMCRLMGFKVSVIAVGEFNLDTLSSENLKWIIIAADPDSLPEKFTNYLMTILKNHSICVISRVGKFNSPFSKCSRAWDGKHVWKGKNIKINFPGVSSSILCRDDIECCEVSFDVIPEIIVSLEDFPMILSTRMGIGSVILLAFNPSQLRDQEGSVTYLLQRLLLFTCKAPTAYLNWQNTLVLRMDDPGSSETVHNNRYQQNKVRKEEWSEIGEQLSKLHGRMTIGYVCGWVDDANHSRGELLVEDNTVIREPGKVYPSPTIKYKKLGTKERILLDYSEEYESIQELRKMGLAEVEMHGFTHISPDRNAWLKAADKYENSSWFREFGNDAMQFLKKNQQNGHPLDSGLEYFDLFFRTKPTTLISPGEVFTNDILVDALSREFMLVSSYYLALRDKNRFCWCQHVCAPYLDQSEEKWFDARLPVVGYFHDFDITEKGTSWFLDCLNEWKTSGAKRFIDFRTLSTALTIQLEIQFVNNEPTVVWSTHPLLNLRTPIPVGLYFPDGVPETIRVDSVKFYRYLTVTKIEDNMGVVLLEC